MKYKVLYLAKTKDNSIPFALFIKAKNKDKAKLKINRLFEKNSKKKNCEYELLKIEEVKRC